MPSLVKTKGPSREDGPVDSRRMRRLGRVCKVIDLLICGPHPLSLSLVAMHYPHLERKSRVTTPHPRPLSHASGERGVGRFD